eukprot:1159183-Pelagomonas_calceolata.AAC.26
MDRETPSRLGQKKDASTVHGGYRNMLLEVKIGPTVEMRALIDNGRHGWIEKENRERACPAI